MTNKPYAMPSAGEPQQSMRLQNSPWITAKSSLAVTAGLAACVIVFSYFLRSDDDQSVWLGLYGFMVVLPSAFALLLLTPLQAIATVADFATKRNRRACMSLLATIIGLLALVSLRIAVS